MSHLAGKIDSEIVSLLQGGAVGLLPSDTIYGLSCDAMNELAVEKIRKLKKRDENKSFIILISDYSMLERFGVRHNKKILEQFWPGALTVIFDAPNAPSWLKTKDNTIAIRMPSSINLQKLISATGPLVSTSANISGGVPAVSPNEALAYFDDKLDFIVDVGKISAKPSTIVKIENDKFKVIRQGSVKIKDTE